jgi:hypothetical protein
MNWQYTHRPDRAFANLNLSYYPVSKPPLPPFVAWKFREEKQRRNSALEFASLPPSDEYWETLPEPAEVTPPWKKLWKITKKNVMSVWDTARPWLRFCWKLIVMIFVWVIEIPTKWAYDISRRVDWWAILFVIWIGWFLRLFPSPFEVELAKEGGIEISKPLYVLIISSGGEYRKLIQDSIGHLPLLTSHGQRAWLLVAFRIARGVESL